jgi:hypothetical protein
MNNIVMPISIAVCGGNGGLPVHTEQVTVPPDLATEAGFPAYVEIFVEDGARFAKMAQLEDDWDGEGAPAPSREAIRRANDVVHCGHSRLVLLRTSKLMYWGALELFFAHTRRLSLAQRGSHA